MSSFSALRLASFSTFTSSFSLALELNSGLGSSVEEWGDSLRMLGGRREDCFSFSSFSSFSEEDDLRMLGGRREDGCLEVEADHHSPSLLWKTFCVNIKCEKIGSNISLTKIWPLEMSNLFQISGLQIRSFRFFNLFEDH